MRQLIFDNEVGTYDVWGLILTKLHVPLPEVKTHFLTTEYGHGIIDMTDAIDNSVFYGERNCVFEFDLVEEHTERERIINELSARLHGQRVSIRVPDRPQTRLEGRLSVEVNRVYGNLAKVIMNATCDPFFLSVGVSEYTKDIAYGNPNLLNNGKFTEGMDRWELIGQAKYRDAGNNIALIYREEDALGEMGIRSNTKVNLYANQEYTISFKGLDYYLNLLNIFKVTSRSEDVELNPNNLVNHGPTAVEIYGSPLNQYSLSFTLERDVNEAEIVIGNTFPQAYPHETGFYLAEVKLETGEMTPWEASLEDQALNVFEMDILNGPIAAEARLEVTADTWVTVDNEVYFFNERLNNHLNFRIPAFATKLQMRTNDNNMIKLTYYERSL